MGRKKQAYSYITTPQYSSIIRDGWKPVKDYKWFVLFEKDINGYIIRECFSKFELYGATWTNSPALHRDGFHYNKRIRARV